MLVIRLHKQYYLVSQLLSVYTEKCVIASSPLWSFCIISDTPEDERERERERAYSNSHRESAAAATATHRQCLQDQYEVRRRRQQISRNCTQMPTRRMDVI
jgi:hypothetical protein